MYGLNKNRVESVLFVKPKPAITTTRDRGSSTFLSPAEDNNSVVRRPIRHINNMCLCYENKEDCTTCTSEESSTKSDIFIVEDSDSEHSELRLRGGSSPTISTSSDGSSLFGEGFVQENLVEKVDNEIMGSDGLLSEEMSSSLLPAYSVNKNIYYESSTSSSSSSESKTSEPSKNRLNNAYRLNTNIYYESSTSSSSSSESKTPEPSAILELKHEIRQLPMIHLHLKRSREDWTKFAEKQGSELEKSKTFHGYQMALLDDRLAEISQRLKVQNLDSTEKIDKIDTESAAFDISKSLMEQCHREHVQARREYLDRLLDEDLMKSNLIRIAEMKAENEKFRKSCRPKNVDTQMELEQILDDVSTCLSFDS